MSAARERPAPASFDAGDIADARAALDIARAVAEEAATLLRGSAGKVGRIDTKSTATDLVTEWDRRTEDLIRERLQTLTPAVPLLGEERGAWTPDAPAADEAGASVEGGAAKASDRWLVDPIDGTVNFAHGVPFFAVSIALERRGRSLLGAVYAPALGWNFHAHVGGGAFMNDDRLAVSAVPSLAQAMLASGFPYDRATNPDNNFARWEHFQRRAGACRRFGAASLDLCMVARGSFDGYWESRLSPWDVGAGVVLVEEAGGRVSGYDGGRVDLARGEVVASNGAIHEQILRELEAVPAGAAAQD
ncbi:inositol monophosphatase family protein [Haliangium ochraceum]|uniref:Inositol-1-monophosphatase n=1 Tax=Haliangium ochraceum (strain DSM 14365 / JCM 11303 / SMP-2) TaxID=502025 RepID=D0LJX6_HALO1|nr:inositol monophosphatase family protein [Haliangium ochraceum]ACY18483.1 inositol monophosphatase [Haliangium ochraceum DSM 14365]